MSRLVRLLQSALFVVAVTLLIASPIFATIIYRVALSVSENGTASYNMLPVGVASNNLWMSQNGFMTSSGNDTRVETLGGAAKPHMITENATWTAIPVPLSSQTNLYFTTGNSGLSALNIITGNGGYTTVSDNTSWEMGNNSTIEASGYIDTTVVGANVTDKQGALRTYVSASGNITSALSIAGWTLPAGFSDPDSKWINESNAYDNNTATYAQTDNMTSTSWGSYLVLDTFTALAGSVKYYASGNDITQIDVDVYSGGAWQDVYQGVFTQSTWETKTFAEKFVTQVRVRLYNSASSLPSGVMHEVQIGGNLLAATATGISSGNTTIATTLGTTTRDLAHFDGTATSYMSGGSIYNSQAKFAISLWFRLSSNFAAGAASDQYLFLKEGGGQTAQLRLENSTGQIYLETTAIILPSSENSWIAGQWYHVIASWSDTAGHRLKVNGGAAQTNANTEAMPPSGDVRIGGRGQANGLIGETADVTIVIDDLTPAEETALYNGTAPGDETDLWALDEGTGTSITSYGSSANTGTLQASNTWTSASAPHSLSITIGGVWKAGKSLRGQSVADNANDWTFGQAFAYMNYYKHTVDDVLVGWYQPTAMISGSTLPDRSSDGVDHPGTITWGTNPANITVTFGSLVSSSQVAVGQTTDRPTRDILPEAPVSNWFQAPDVSGTLLTHPLRPFVVILSDTTTLSERQAWVFLGLVAVLAVAIGVGSRVRGHQLITGVAVAATIVALSIQTIWPYWSLVFAVIAIIGGIISERSPSL